MRFTSKLVAIGAGVLITLFFLWVGYERIMNRINCPTEYRTKMLDAPTYPHITQIITATQTSYAHGEREQQIFLTNDPPEIVNVFYLNTLRAQGWREVRRDTTKEGYNWIGFRETELIPIYDLGLYTKQIGKGTEVEVNLFSDDTPCFRG